MVFQHFPRKDYSKKGLFQEMENIILHKHTSEASICKSGFPQKMVPPEKEEAKKQKQNTENEKITKNTYGGILFFS